MPGERFDCVIVNWRTSPAEVLEAAKVRYIVVADDDWTPTTALRRDQVVRLVESAAGAFVDAPASTPEKVSVREGDKKLDRYVFTDLIVQATRPAHGNTSPRFQVTERANLTGPMDAELPGDVTIPQLYLHCKPFGHPNFVAFYDPDQECTVRPPTHTIG